MPEDDKPVTREVSIDDASAHMDDLLAMLRQAQTAATGIHAYDRSTWHDEAEPNQHEQGFGQDQLPTHPLLHHNSQRLAGKSIDNLPESAIAAENDDALRQALQQKYQKRLQLQQQLANRQAPKPSPFG